MTFPLPCCNHNKPNKSWSTPNEATSVWVPSQERRKNAVPQVPARLPTVDSAIMLPVWRPRYPISTTANRSNAGMTPLNPNAGGANNTQAARLGPHRGSSTSLATLKMATCPIQDISNVQAPEPSRSQASTAATRYRSDAQPPNAYPELMAARMIPIKAPQTNSEFPNTGASKRLPRISSAMTMAPVTSAVMSRNRRGMREAEVPCAIINTGPQKG